MWNKHVSFTNPQGQLVRMPQGNMCMVCVYTVTHGYTGLSWESAIHSKNSVANWFKEFQKARRFVEQRAHQGLLKPGIVEGEVEKVKVTGRRVEESS